jgi:predicted PurR-regulated permease PerM
MEDPSSPLSEKEFTTRTIETAIRLVLVLVILGWCVRIVLPFIIPVVWGIIIAVAIYPVFDKLQLMLGGREKLAAIVYLLVTVSLVVIPAVMIAGSFIETSKQLVSDLNDGSLTIPPPGTNIREWPLIGAQAHDVWMQASENLEETARQYAPEIKEIGGTLLAAATGAGGGILQLIFSLIISVVFLTKASVSNDLMLKILQRLCGEKQGEHYNTLARTTIRSVSQGVVGVAIIQSSLAALGLYLMNVPGWGLWALLILVFAVGQLPLLLILLPISGYVFSVSEALPATLFTVWSILVSASEAYLKPLFLGRGIETPTMVILLGAIGGLILSGILGLFVGAIVLALGYELFMSWLNRATADKPEKNGTGSTTGQ